MSYKVVKHKVKLDDEFIWLPLNSKILEGEGYNKFPNFELFVLEDQQEQMNRKHKIKFVSKEDILYSEDLAEIQEMKYLGAVTISDAYYWYVWIEE